MTRQYFGWFQYRGLHYSGITMIFGKEAPRNLNKSTSTNQKASWKNIRLPWKNTFQSVCDLLWKLHELHPDRPITLVLDNARYQKCKLLSEQAERLGLDLLYLPPYSPNLNIIERLWQFVKKNCLYSKYYPDFETFKQAISSCLSHTRDQHKKQLDTLLTLKFQRFDPETMCG